LLLHLCLNTNQSGIHTKLIVGSCTVCTVAIQCKSVQLLPIAFSRCQLSFHWYASGILTAQNCPVSKVVVSKFEYHQTLPTHRLSPASLFLHNDESCQRCGSRVRLFLSRCSTHPTYGYSLNFKASPQGQPGFIRPRFQAAGLCPAPNTFRVSPCIQRLCNACLSHAITGLSCSTIHALSAWYQRFQSPSAP
jgi:hypothetical protein